MAEFLDLPQMEIYPDTVLHVIEDHSVRLMEAACGGNAGIIRLLLDQGADVNAQAADGKQLLLLGNCEHL